MGNKKIIASACISRNSPCGCELTGEEFGADMIKLCRHEKCSHLKLVQDMNGKDRIAKVMFD